jgi:hypothetical protein
MIELQARMAQRLEQNIERAMAAPSGPETNLFAEPAPIAATAIPGLPELTAAERAIVRLTRRIEKLKERRDRGAARPSSTPRLGWRSGRSLMGRLLQG